MGKLVLMVVDIMEQKTEMGPGRLEVKLGGTLARTVCDEQNRLAPFVTACLASRNII